VASFGDFGSFGMYVRVWTCHQWL